MQPVIVVEVHEESNGLSQDYTGPYYHITNLSLSKGTGGQNTKGKLRKREGKKGDYY